jgi:hypothetical protein
LVHHVGRSCIARAALVGFLPKHPEPIALAETLLLGLVGGHVGALGGRQLDARTDVDDPPGRLDDAPARPQDPAVGPDCGPHGDGLPERDLHPGGHAPVVLGHQGPSHHLVEDRAEDPAVGESLPAFEAAIEHELGPGPGGFEMQSQLQAMGIQRAAGEAVMGLELEPGERGGPGLAQLRCQGSGPSGPRP